MLSGVVGVLSTALRVLSDDSVLRRFHLESAQSVVRFSNQKLRSRKQARIHHLSSRLISEISSVIVVMEIFLVYAKCECRINIS